MSVGSSPTHGFFSHQNSTCSTSSGAPRSSTIERNSRYRSAYVPFGDNHPARRSMLGALVQATGHDAWSPAAQKKESRNGDRAGAGFAPFLIDSTYETS